MTPLLSIVVPTLDRRETLEHVLPTLIRQTASPDTYEVVLCDGGSRDGTAELVRNLAIPALRWLPNAGPSRAACRNAGVGAARGEWVLFTDADILADAGLVESHLAAHRQAPDSAVVGWEIQVASLDEYRALVERRQHAKSLHPRWTRTLSWCFFLTGNASVSREALSRVGGFDESFTGYGHEDLELGYRLERSGLRIRYEPKAVNYHWHPHSFEQRLEKMEASGAATVHCFRKHRDPMMLLKMGVNPVTWLGHAIVDRAPRLRARWRNAGPQSPVSQALALQDAYMSGAKRAWRVSRRTP